MDLAKANRTLALDFLMELWRHLPHLAPSRCLPCRRPVQGVRSSSNSTQGGENVLIYGIPTRIKQMGLLERTGEGNHIYRVRYNGSQMELLEDIADSTGLGLGVHTVIYPDADGFAGADGQKDIAGFFDRPRGTERTRVQMAFRGDWQPRNSTSLARGWLDGGRCASHG